MKRKLFLGLLAAAAVSFTACQKDSVINEVPQEQEIGFGTYVGRDAQTKASVSDIDAMKTSGFGVYAYYTGDETWDEVDDTATPTFFTNEKVQWSTSIDPDGWDYVTKKYWPGETVKHMISFFAYAPYQEIKPLYGATDYINTLPIASTTGRPTIKYTVPTNVTEQIDLLVAEPILDNYYNKEINSVKNGGNVSFTFNHVLSRIAFKVKTASENCKVNVNEITITGLFAKTSTLYLDNGNFSHLKPAENTAYTITFTNLSTNAKDIDNTGKVINADDEYIMVIPTTEEEFTIDVEYEYFYKYDGDNWSTTAQPATATGTVTTAFGKGKAYNLVLELDPLKPIVFVNAEVSEWTPTIGTDTDVNVTNN